MSTPGDWVGAGATEAYAPPAATIKVSGTLGSLTVSVSQGADWWYLDLAAPTGSQLAPGVYTDAQRAAFRNPGHPGVDFSGDGRGCNDIFGSFTINAINSDRLGNVTMLDATFVQHCETAAVPALTGSVQVNAPDAAPVALNDQTPDTVLGQPVNLTAHASPAGGSVTFRDGSTAMGSAPIDANGFAQLTTTSLAVGSHNLTAAYKGGTSPIVVHTVRSNTDSLWFQSGAGDFVGQGATESYATPTDQITITGTASDVRVTVEESNYDHWWSIEFAGADSQALHAGTYPNAERWPFEKRGTPGLRHQW